MTSNKKENVFQSLKNLWPTVRQWLVTVLLKRLAPKIFGGVAGTAVALFLEKMFDAFLRPLWDRLWSKVNAAYKKLKRKPKVKEFEEARNESDFDDSFDDLP